MTGQAFREMASSRPEQEEIRQLQAKVRPTLKMDKE